MSEEGPIDYPLDLKTCHNCKFYMDGICTKVNRAPENPKETCPIGEFDPIDVKKMMQDAYENIMRVIDYYVDMPNDIAKILTLWTIGTHFHEHFTTFPYLFANAMRGSGKTRTLKIINAFAKDSQLVNSVTESTMFRTVGTLCMDEFEGVASKDNQHLRELLNSAYKKGTKVMRMKKSKNLKEEGYVVEYFEPYRPICMANIWGMEEVLGDRCINIQLEKSTDLSKIKLIENFEDIFEVEYAKKVLTILNQCSLCSVVSPRNIKQHWNNYTKSKHDTTLLTHNTYITYTTLTTQELVEGKTVLDKDYTWLFDLINDTQIDGRNLELFFPLFIIAAEMDDEKILLETLEYAKTIVKARRVEEITESKDVMVYRLVSSQEEGKWVDVSSLVNTFKMVVGGGEEADQVNARWMGRALKRLNLVIDKRRIGSGIQVTLNVPKSTKKLEMFAPKEDSNDMKGGND